MSATSDPLDDWILKHQVGPWRFLRLCGCPADLADDLVQEALLAALHKRVHQEPDAVAASWLRAAVTNLWRMHLRAQRSRGAGMALAEADLALAELAYEQCAADDGGEAWLAALAECMARIDARARKTLRLRYEENLSREETARRLGLTVEGVKAKLRRIREALRECILRRLEVAHGGAR